MLIIRIIAPECVKTITIEEVPDREIIYRPCQYNNCEILVAAPQKFCTDSHRVMFYKKVVLSARVTPKR